MGSFDGVGLTDAESFGGSLVQTVTVGANSSYDVPLLLEWNQAYGAATSNLEVLVFSNGRLVQTATNATYGETGNPWVYVDLAGGATYQIAVENLSGPNPGLIKEIAAGDGLPVTINGANVGTVYGHAMTPGVISAGAVSAAATPAFGVNPALSEFFSSSGSGTELLFANNGTALSSPDVISPVAVSGVDDIATTVPGGLSDFYGTSASSASLAGVAALILSANPNLTPAAVELLMEETALPMANAAVSGAGLVQVDVAVAAAQTRFAVTGTSAEAVQGGVALGLLTAAPVVSDAAATNLTGATVKIANGSGVAVTGDELYVNGQQSGTVSGITASWNDTTKTLTLTGSGSIATYETLLSEISYKDTGTDTSSGSHPVRTVSWSIGDGTSSYNTTSQVTIDRPPVASSDAVAAAAGATVTKNASTGVLANDTDLDGDTLTVTGVSDTAHGAGTIGRSLAGAYGHLTLNADGSYSYLADNASAIAAAATGSHPGDSFTYTASDGHGGTTTATLLFALDRAPVVAAANVALSAGHASVAASSLLSVTDPDGDAIVTYGFIDGGPGAFVLNGVTQSNNHEIDVTAAQLSQLVYQSATGSLDTLQVRVYDGTLWSGWQSFTVTAPALLIQADTNSFGSVDLTELGNAYYLYNSSGVGPILKVGGAPILAGAAGPGWSPYGAVETATGYDVAWKNTVYGVYTEWQTDSSGNYISDTIGAVTASNQTYEALETTFNQDLNGDGVIGIPAIVIQTDTNAYGSIALLQSGNEYLLHNSSGVGPVLQSGGAPVVAGSQGAGWVPFGAVETASGFDVAWKNATSGLYMVWQTDSNGNLVSNAVGAVTGSNLTLEGLETTFNQDLNGDGTIGVVATVIQTDTNAYGSIALLQSANEYYLHNNSSGVWPVLQSGGAPVVAGGVGAGWVPFGAVETASGFDVAWKNATSGLYMVWQTDSNGNFIANAVGAVTGSNLTLEGLETTFNQDLNGDGTIGVPTTVIQTDTNAYGSITLLESGNEYYLHNSSGVGPVLQSGGAPVVAGSQGAGWVPFGAVETASGFDVAWKNTTSGLYMVWQTDSNGNFVANAVGAVTGGNLTLEGLETTFNQDLNGDEIIGVAATVIQTDTNSYGSITLLESGNEYYLHNSSGAGPVLQVGGAPIMDGAAGPGWAPYGAVETATGYDVAWKNTVYGVYTEWQTDSNGNYASDTIGAVTRNSPTLEALETTFNQDLNGDGTIGLPGTTVIQTDTNSYGSITLLETGNEFYLHNSSGLGPVLQSGGAPVAAGGEGAGWVPFGAVETATGYDVAWKNTISGLYMVWQTDSNGNFVANAVGAVAGSNLTLEGLETTFNQDLNGDGTIGVPATVIQTDTNAYGSITLLESGNEYFLHNSSGVGPVLQSGGAPVTDGSQGAGWEPFGAVETATGYDVAWKNTTSGLYTVWQTDSSGHFVANAVGAVAGSNLTLEGLETTFNQDLNGDGTIGVPAIVIQTDTNSYGSITLLEFRERVLPSQQQWRRAGFGSLRCADHGWRCRSGLGPDWCGGDGDRLRRCLEEYGLRCVYSLADRQQCQLRLGHTRRSNRQ